MNLESLTRQFARIGATLEIDALPAVQGRNAASNYSLDIKEEGRREFYLLEIAKPAIETIDFQVLNTRTDLRHLVLMARNESASIAAAKQKFLCGHDERHWFVASLPAAGVTDVTSAMEALKPTAAVWSQRRNGVRQKDRNKRHNAGFIRQGEWFFIPEPNFSPWVSDIIQKDEPLSRGFGSKPHRVSELLRHGGEQVYVNWRTKAMLSVAQYTSQLRQGRLKNARDWSVQWLANEVYVRGKVRHADHKTIELKGWHRVAMNAEPTSNNVRFLD